MKSNTVICDRNGNRLVTSTTEQLRIPASEIRPGDWLLKPHRRGMEKDKPVLAVEHGCKYVFVSFVLGAHLTMRPDAMVDVERTT